ncbi:MAG TPA: LON peptidase substrate-binding domain-containing protein [Arenimonas sp.]|nr:LON peptidase substrate-binding domain-containing protein [Arenimonas sp.]HOZ04853.1 LON peptidase substrate-binding domain-containing protein [Arenimonas sp.]HPW32916.1 LON peptidase substrate-binding domain-containing protein [Arenimonas sp.]
MQRYTIRVSNAELPLFPLNTVLFPGGILPLRIFEPRYLDMVKDCMRNNHGFGVCMIIQGEEVGQNTASAALGCEARIVDFDQTPDGLLAITALGERRFHVEQVKIRNNGLVIGEVSWLAAAQDVALAPEYFVLSQILQRVLDKAEISFDKKQLEDADWVSWRLAEWLPLSNLERQELLQESDAQLRLQNLLEKIPNFQSI